MVRPRVCVVLSAPSCVVEKLPSAVVVRPPSCVAVSALACVVVKAWISVVVSVPICAVVSAATWVEVMRRDLGRGQVADRGGVEARDLRGRELVEVERVRGWPATAR